MLNSFAGYQLIPSSHITKVVQYKFPRCNKKKWRKVKKFAKKYTKTVPDHEKYYVVGRTIICHPVALEMLKRAAAGTIS